MTFLPTTTILIQQTEIARKAMRLCDALEECDDILQLHSNFNVANSVLEKLGS